jgi:ubiquinone/menaquinone biosynthesis C-methylase UbiE
MREKAIQPEQADTYTKMSAEVYDLIYSEKRYDEEASKVKDTILTRCKSGGNQMLDVACGTGKHMEFLRDIFNVEGVDLSEEQLAVAKAKFPDARIEQGNMINFDMGKQYDSIICLFSSIGYVKTKENLDLTVNNMSRHLKPGGVILIEPWIRPEVFEPGNISLESNADRKDLKVVRAGISTREGNISILNMHHMIVRPDSVDHFVEKHELAMFTDKEFADAYKEAGLGIEIDPEGLTGRRLMIGTKPL